MAAVLSLFMLYLIVAKTFDLDIGLGPGLSLKNGILYLLMTAILMMYAVRRDFKLQLPGIFGSFAALLAYAVFSTAVVVMFVQYPGYKLLTAFIQLKGLPFDFLAFFFVYFYGLRTRRDALTVLYSSLAIAVLVNVVSGLDALGYLRIESIRQGEDSERVQGIIGEHNQYGAYIAWFLPPLVAMIASVGKRWRVFWVLGALVSFAVLLMTVSRGAFVATVVSTLIGAYLFRSTLLTPKVGGRLLMVFAAALVVAIGLAVTTKFGSLLAERLLGQSADIDLWEVSSGRTELWKDALEQMMRTPSSLLTGFGWATYFVLPSSLPLAPHNTYLWYWFELGIPGVLLFTMIFVQLIMVASREAAASQGSTRFHLIGFAIGTIALMVAIFFVELYTPWPYYWAYAGAIMRLAMIAKAERESSAVQPQGVQAQRVADRFGWAVSPAQR
jgi:O-antigen ligase